MPAAKVGSLFKMKERRIGMKINNKGKKSFIRIVCVLLCLAAAFSVCLVFKVSPTARYALSDKIAHIGTAAKLEKTSDLSFEEYTLDELKENAKVTFDNNLMLINTEHPLDGSYETEICDYKDRGVLMSTALYEPFEALSNEVLSRFDETLYVSSSYRTKEEQEKIKEEEGDTAQAVGASEHQAGLALDVYVMYYAGMGFIKSDAGRFVNDSCSDYGFIIRYPYYGEKSTGISWEPWHIRYVGKPHSEIIYKNSMTLEEYTESLKVGEFYEYDGYVISRQNAEKPIKLPQKFKSATISPDNCGNYTVTVAI